MKTKKEVISEHIEFKTFINAVLRGIDLEQIPDINRNGIENGFGNFIYYTDTVKFWRKYRKQILLLIQYEANIYCCSSILYCSGNFKYLLSENPDDVAKALFGQYNPEYDNYYNYFTWIAVTIVCNWFED